MSKVKITYLNHSGFMVEADRRCYVFDYYRDPSKQVAAKLAEGKELWFFVTHRHGDHYVPDILAYQDERTRYIVHKDVPQRGMPAERTVVMNVGDTTQVEEVTISMYGSTDEGGSFLLDLPEGKIFHAGDLNWWHWLGDTVENNRFAYRYMRQEFERLRGLTVDVAFFPVDIRLEGAQEWGVIEFLRYMKVNTLLIPMHTTTPWKPSTYFKALYEGQALWIPQANGDITTVVLADAVVEQPGCDAHV